MAAALLFMELVSPGKSIIKGESQIEGYEGQIELNDWSWALTRGKGKQKKMAEPAVFSFSKRLDRSTSALLSCLRNGQVLPTATITLVEMSSADFDLTVVLKEIRVLEYGLEGQMNELDGTLEESWVFNYHTIEFNYRPSQKLPPAQRGLVRVQLTRPPNASTKAGAGDVDAKLTEIMEKVPDKERKPTWSRLDKKLPTLKSLDPAKPDEK